MSALTHPDPALKKVENVYLTARIRMRSEVRLRNNGKILNVIITWYSFLLIAFSIADIAKILEFKFFSTLSTACSVGILIASLVMQGERYQERAEKFRECYLKLQSLYASADLPLEDKICEYHKILGNYENHSDYDYQYSIVSAWWNDKSLENGDGKLQADWNMILYIFTRKVAEFVFLVFSLRTSCSCL